MSREKETGIIPECYVDTNLTETLTGFICNHQKGCANVAKQMKEKRAERFALGIIDSDKRKVGYADEFEEWIGDNCLKVMKHKDRPHYLIYIVPAVEVFIIKAASEAGIDLTDYGLPSRLEDLKRETKQQDSNKDPRFRRLFTALQDSPRLRLLKSLIIYLREHPYEADKNEIINLFSRDS